MSDKMESGEQDIPQPEISSLLSLTRDAVIISQIGGTITSYNPSAERLFGYAAEEVIGKSISLLLTSNGPNQWLLIAEQARRGVTIENLETQMTKKGGPTVDVLASLSPIRDGIGRVIGVL